MGFILLMPILMLMLIAPEPVPPPCRFLFFSAYTLVSSPFFAVRHSDTRTHQHRADVGAGSGGSSRVDVDPPNQLFVFVGADVDVDAAHAGVLALTIGHAQQSIFLSQPLRISVGPSETRRYGISPQPAQRRRSRPRLVRRGRKKRERKYQR